MADNKKRVATAVVLMVLARVVHAGAATGESSVFDSATIPAAFPQSTLTDSTVTIADIRSKLPADVSVIDQGHLVIVSDASADDAGRLAQRVARYDAAMRRHNPANRETRRTIVVLAGDTAAYRRLAKALYPGLAASQLPPSGFYHREDRLILASTVNGDVALRRELMRAVVLDDNPDAPRWFEQAAATLYESSEWRSGRLTPTLDRRMQSIAPDEDLAYDVFAGVCDCSAISSEQLALIRLLLIFLEQRDELQALQAAIRNQGRYTTLLEALDSMNFHRGAWKDFAETRVRAYSR
jgi:hypothetical protein